VTKLSAADGSVLDTSPVRSSPVGIAFDGVDVWILVAGLGTLNPPGISRFHPDGHLAAAFYELSSAPSSVAFDGTSMWIAFKRVPFVTRLRVSDGAALGTSLRVGQRPTAIAFDGASIWTANSLDGTVSKRPR